ncbi:MAG: hypothetical protein ACE5F1_17775, partial [Planctomycetota bacterium]
GKDKITKTNGQVIRGVLVLAETLESITYSRGSKEQSVPAKYVQAIHWDPAPEAYARALFNMERGDFGTAANLFAEAADKSDRPALQADAGFRAAEALYLDASSEAAKAAQAAGQLKSWLDKNPEHRRMPRAYELLGESLLLSGELDHAIDAFGKLEKKVNDAGLGPVWLARCKCGLGRAYIVKKDFLKARQAFQTASASLSAQSESTDPEVLNLSIAARIGEGECLIAEGRNRDAQQYFDRLQSTARVKRNDALYSAALCGKGQAIFEAAAPGKKDRELRDAQLCFAEVTATDLLDGDSTAKALYFLGRTILILGKEHEGKGYSSMAEACFEHVTRQFRHSRWAFLARKALKK